VCVAADPVAMRAELIGNSLVTGFAFNMHFGVFNRSKFDPVCRDGLDSEPELGLRDLTFDTARTARVDAIGLGAQLPSLPSFIRWA